MSNGQQWTEGGDLQPLALGEATPPLNPAPMPRQVILFWTPRSIFGEALQVLKGMRYRPSLTAPNLDER